MKRLPVLCAIIVLAACAVLRAQQAPASADKPSPCKELTAKLSAGATIIDYDLLRSSCVDDPMAAEVGDDAQQKQAEAMFAALNNKKFAEALKLAEATLMTNAPSLDARFVAYIAARESGATEQAKFHQAVLRGLLHSITQGRDGRTPATCWNAVVVHEEYVALRLQGYTVKKQSLAHADGHSYDVMTVTSDAEKDPIDIYFNIDKIWAGYEKTFSKDKNK